MFYLHMSKLRHLEVKELILGQIATKWSCQRLNLQVWPWNLLLFSL